jgi:hypothetical protein
MATRVTRSSSGKVSPNASIEYVDLNTSNSSEESLHHTINNLTQNSTNHDDLPELESGPEEEPQKSSQHLGSRSNSLNNPSHKAASPSNLANNRRNLQISDSEDENLLGYHSPSNGALASSDLKVESPECLICLDNIHDATSLDCCGHIFCYECIYRWLSDISSTCPLCKKDAKSISHWAHKNSFNFPNNEDNSEEEISKESIETGISMLRRGRSANKLRGKTMWDVLDHPDAQAAALLANNSSQRLGDSPDNDNNDRKDKELVTIPIKTKVQTVPNDYYDTFSPPSPSILNSYCYLCSLDNDESVLLLCDSCDSAAHTYCLGLRDIPQGDWHCNNCRKEQKEQEISRNQQRKNKKSRNRLITVGEYQRRRANNGNISGNNPPDTGPRYILDPDFLSDDSSDYVASSGLDEAEKIPRKTKLSQLNERARQLQLAKQREILTRAALRSTRRCNSSSSLHSELERRGSRVDPALRDSFLAKANLLYIQQQAENHVQREKFGGGKGQIDLTREKPELIEKLLDQYSYNRKNSSREKGGSAEKGGNKRGREGNLSDSDSSQVNLLRRRIPKRSFGNNSPGNNLYSVYERIDDNNNNNNNWAADLRGESEANLDRKSAGAGYFGTPQRSSSNNYRNNNAPSGSNGHNNNNNNSTPPAANNLSVLQKATPQSGPDITKNAPSSSMVQSKYFNGNASSGSNNRNNNISSGNGPNNTNHHHNNISNIVNNSVGRNSNAVGRSKLSTLKLDSFLTSAPIHSKLENHPSASSSSKANVSIKVNSSNLSSLASPTTAQENLGKADNGLRNQGQSFDEPNIRSFEEFEFHSSQHSTSNKKRHLNRRK